MKKLFALMAATALALATASPALAQTVSDQQKSEIQSLVREYLLNNPEILREMAERLEEKDKRAESEKRAKALSEHAEAIFRNENDPVIGNPQGDVTVVEFVDYNCSWCRRSVSEVQRLVDEDKNVKVVLKEFPIFGEHSEYAAKAALAARLQGKYWQMHTALFSHEGQVTKDVVDQLAEGLSLDMKKLKADMADAKIQATLAKNDELARAMAFNGTPAFIIGETVVPGYIPYDQIMMSVAEVRASGGCKLC